MRPFHLLFPEIEYKETRTSFVGSGWEKLLPGGYGFVEMYCVEPDCDCRRVIIKVVRHQPPDEVATINHAFDPLKPGDSMPSQTFLDPLHIQSPFASELLDLFLQMVKDDPAYEARIQRHYRMVKEAIALPGHSIHSIIARLHSTRPNPSRDARRRAQERRAIENRRRRNRR